MIRKFAYTLVIVLFNANFSIAENKTIEIHESSHNIEIRSLIPPIRASHDGVIIQIFSEIPLEEYKIQIIDSNNKTIYSEIVDLTPYQPHTFIINYNEKDTLLLEIGNEKVKYYGYFEII